LGMAFIHAITANADFEAPHDQSCCY